jgi:hypothetical protein
MKSQKQLSVLTLLVLFVLALPRLSYGADEAGQFGNPASPGALTEGQTVFEVIGQVKNSPSPGPGLPATSVQYGYLSHIPQLTDNETFLPGSVQNDTTAVFTFYNESTTLRITPHGRWIIIVREGTMTVYYHPASGADLTTPNPDSFRSGTPIQTSTWRHQVIFEPAPSGLFFVTFTNTITSSSSVDVGGKMFRLGRPGEKFRMSLVGGPDPAGLVNGKFAGTAIATSE